MIVTPHHFRMQLGKATGAKRSPGLHMSDIYNDFYEMIEPKRYKADRPIDPATVEMGLLFEQGLEEWFKERQAEKQIGLGKGETWTRPGERTVLMAGEPVLFSPDGIIKKAKTPDRLGEIKLTWKSCRDCPIDPVMAEGTALQPNWDGVDAATFPPRFDKYFDQMMLYAKSLNLNVGRLIAMFVTGDYAAQRLPVVLAWNLQWSPIELNENWTKYVVHGVDRSFL